MSDLTMPLCKGQAVLKAPRSTEKPHVLLCFKQSSGGKKHMHDTREVYKVQIRCF